MEVYNHAKKSNPKLNMPEWTESDTIAYRHYQMTYPGSLETQARMSSMIINDTRSPVVSVLLGEYEGKCPSYYFQGLHEETMHPFQNPDLPDHPSEEKTDGERFISPPPPPSSPMENKFDEANNKAMEIFATKGADVAAKHMLESCGNDYTTMRMMYG